MSNILLEVTRKQLLDKSKKGANYAPSNRSRGKNRYARRVYSKVSNSVAAYNEIDFNNLFKNDVLIFNIDVKGETNTYVVKLKFKGVLEAIRKFIKQNNNKLEFKCIYQGLMDVFLHGDVYIMCTCPDFKYNFKHWSYVNDYTSGKPGDDPGPGKGIANPGDTKGAGCKHTMCVLANKTWLFKVAATINNYINYIKDKHIDKFNNIMYPKLFGHPYKEPNKTYKPIQVKNLEKPGNMNRLKSTRKEIDIANKYGKDRGKFKKGNKLGYKFTKSNDGSPDQININNKEEK